MDVTKRPAEADPDNWCDWCADRITGTPIRWDERVFCSFTCAAESKAAKTRTESEQP